MISAMFLVFRLYSLKILVRKDEALFAFGVSRSTSVGLARVVDPSPFREVGGVARNKIARSEFIE